ncbi:ABC transporter substrate-binding protein [Paenibacillus sp. N3/727]|uniref:ABC transporter substrate-binding protein n=1 Tax=Paenibacillus sp. N3/727 TaxID=2925845 RepID=UPI001F5334B4|nr:ABC transporter substrate-binding protein [Paenibacillus sp. N3/727]UNK18346.1 ABC transporter substrate-binding protein [Paenibacillus sp. N3/727]
MRIIINIYKKSLVLLSVICLVVLTACGSSKEVSQSSENKSVDTKAVAAEETRVVQTVNGEVTIPANPQRIVTQAGLLATLLALDVKPIGAGARDIDNPHIQDLVEGVENIGEGTDYEKILELQPDLIITQNHDAGNYEKLSKIAPTVVYPYLTFKNVKEEVQEVGKLIGKEEQAKEWETQFDTRMAAARERAQAVVGDQTVSLIGAFEKDIYVYGDSLYRGGEALFQYLQLTPTDAIAKEVINNPDEYLVISYEVLEEYAGDYIFVDESKGGSLNTKSPIWNNLKAVKNKQVLFPKPERFWPYDPISVANQAEEFADMLEGLKKK